MDSSLQPSPDIDISMKPLKMIDRSHSRPLWAVLLLLAGKAVSAAIGEKQFDPSTSHASCISMCINSLVMGRSDYIRQLLSHPIAPLNQSIFEPPQYATGIPMTPLLGTRCRPSLHLPAVPAMTSLLGLGATLTPHAAQARTQPPPRSHRHPSTTVSDEAPVQELYRSMMAPG